MKCCAENANHILAVIGVDWDSDDNDKILGIRVDRRFANVEGALSLVVRCLPPVLTSLRITAGSSRGGNGRAILIRKQ